MEGTMEKTTKMLAFLHPIIEEADPELEDFLVRCVKRIDVKTAVGIQLFTGDFFKFCHESYNSTSPIWAIC